MIHKRSTALDRSAFLVCQQTREPIALIIVSLSCANADNSVRRRGSDLFLLFIYVFHRGPYRPPRGAIWPKGSNCSSVGGQSQLKKTIANCDFQGAGADTLSPLWIRPSFFMYVSLFICVLVSLLFSTIDRSLICECVFRGHIQCLMWYFPFLYVRTMGILLCRHKYSYVYCEHMYCLYTGKSKISIENVTFYLSKACIWLN